MQIEFSAQSCAGKEPRAEVDRWKAGWANQLLQGFNWLSESPELGGDWHRRTPTNHLLCEPPHRLSEPPIATSSLVVRALSHLNCVNGLSTHHEIYCVLQCISTELQGSLENLRAQPAWMQSRGEVSTICYITCFLFINFPNSFSFS